MQPLMDGAGQLPGIFEKTIFSPPRRFVATSAYIKAMHPKTEISPTLVSVEKILRAGWAGQMKIHGHRAQLHVCADEGHETLAYNRQGRLHKKLLPPEIEKELRRIFEFADGWTAIDAEWIKPENKLYVFDILKKDDEVLRRLTYEERYKLLPRSYISRYVQTLPLLTTSEKCMEVLARTEDHIEGLVFKSLKTKGFEDTSIVRCRKKTSL